MNQNWARTRIGRGAREHQERAAQLLVRMVPGPELALTLLLSWLQVVVALAGAFLIVNERAAREAR